MVTAAIPQTTIPAIGKGMPTNVRLNNASEFFITGKSELKKNSYKLLIHIA